jgi:hypothetical protein
MAGYSGMQPKGGSAGRLKENFLQNRSAPGLLGAG